MGRLFLSVLLLVLVQVAGCSGASPAQAAIAFTCNSKDGAKVVALAAKARTASPSALRVVFARLDKQPRVEVRQVNCGLSLVSLRYVRPDRMQFVAWLNGAMRDPRETQIGQRLGYVGHVYSARWVGMGVTAHRMLLPDAWRGITEGSQVGPTFYLLAPPHPPVRGLTVRVLDTGKQNVFVEQWHGLLYRCPPGAQCPAPNPDPRYFARFTAVLRVDRTSGLPVSLLTVAQSHGSDRGRLVWSRPEFVSQATFGYGGTFSIGFVKG